MTSPPTLLPSPAAQPHGVVPRRFICYLRHPFSTSIILSIRPSHRSHTTIHFTSVSCGCILCPTSCVPCPMDCILRPASGFTPCASRSYLLCPLIIAQCPLCIAPSCRLCICCTFSVITISDILPQSNSESRSHVPCPALRVLCPASCFASDYALCSLCSYQHCPLSLAPHPCPSASLVPPLAPYHTSPLQLWFILPYGNSKRCACLFRRYSHEFNRTKVPSAVKPENPNHCSILCKRLKPALLHFCCRFRYCFFEQSIRKILTFALFGYKIKS